MCSIYLPKLRQFLVFSYAESVRLRQFSIEVLKYYIINTKMMISTRLLALKRLVLYCQDESPKVRARSLTQIADCVELFQLPEVPVEEDADGIEGVEVEQETVDGNDGDGGDDGAPAPDTTNITIGGGCDVCCMIENCW